MQIPLNYTQEQMDSITGDFRNFLFVTWKHLNLPEPTKVQYQVAAYLQDPNEKRKIIEGFRGVGKSWITSAFVCWLLLRDPQLKILVVSASKQRADDFSIFTQRLIHEMPILQHLIPSNDQRQSKVAFDVGPAGASHAPSVKSLGITSMLTGSRADVIIGDDVEVPNNSATEDMREKLLGRVMEFEAILTPKKTSTILYLGTPQTEQSIYNKLRERGYHCQIWTAEVPSEDKYNGALHRSIVKMMERGVPAGTPTDPRRFTGPDLAERRLSYGKSGYALQFMLDTSLTDAERYPLRVSDLIVMGLALEKGPMSVSYGSGPKQMLKDLPNPGFDGDRWYEPMWIDSDYVPYAGSIMCVDPSGRGTDETAYAVVKFLNGYLYVTAAGGLKGGYDTETLIKLMEIAKDNQVNKILIEANFGDGMYTQLLKPVMQSVYPCGLEEFKVSGQKEKRILDTLEPVIARHRLVFDYRVVAEDLKFLQSMETNQYQYSLFYQMTHITADRNSLRHDDRLDVLAMAVAYWSNRLAADPDKLAKKLRQEQDRKALEEFFGEAKAKSRLKYVNV